jgi:hypothetical protein
MLYYVLRPRGCRAHSLYTFGLDRSVREALPSPHVRCKEMESFSRWKLPSRPSSIPTSRTRCQPHLAVSWPAERPWTAPHNASIQKQAGMGMQGAKLKDLQRESESRKERIWKGELVRGLDKLLRYEVKICLVSHIRRQALGEVTLQ